MKWCSKILSNDIPVDTLWARFECLKVFADIVSWVNVSFARFCLSPLFGAKLFCLLSTKNCNILHYSLHQIFYAKSLFCLGGLSRSFSQLPPMALECKEVSEKVDISPYQQTYTILNLEQTFWHIWYQVAHLFKSSVGENFRHPFVPRRSFFVFLLLLCLYQRSKQG